MVFLCILEQPLLSANTFPAGHSSHPWAMEETTEGGFGYCFTSTLNFLLDNVWNAEKKFLILYLLLNTGRWHRSTKAVVLHVLCSEKKNAGCRRSEFLVNCFPEMDLACREPRFHCWGGWQAAQLCLQQHPTASVSRSGKAPQALLGKDAREQP